MYNIVMTGELGAWEGSSYNMIRDRCISRNEYTSQELCDRYGALDDVAIRELKRLPTIFAYEYGRKLDPKFGKILDVTVRQGEVRIDYEIIPIQPFITYEDLDLLRFELDFAKWEANRHHWAVKDVDLARELSGKGIVLPEWVHGKNRLIDVYTHNFDVALSFPGEARNYVHEVASSLERILGPNRCFYDKNYQGQLAVRGLDILLQEIYRERSKLIAVFIGGDYDRKDWCGIEWGAIREILNDREARRVIFIRLDNGDVKGILKSDGYVEANSFSPDALAEIISDRLALL